MLRLRVYCFVLEAAFQFRFMQVNTWVSGSLSLVRIPGVQRHCIFRMRHAPDVIKEMVR